MSEGRPVYSTLGKGYSFTIYLTIGMSYKITERSQKGSGFIIPKYNYENNRNTDAMIFRSDRQTLTQSLPTPVLYCRPYNSSIIRKQELSKENSTYLGSSKYSSTLSAEVLGLAS